MIRQMFKLIWNRKRSTSLMILEITLSFIVLFAIGSMVLYGVYAYNKPLGFTYDNVWALKMDWNSGEEAWESKDSSIRETILLFQQEMLSFEEVLHVTPSSIGYPFSGTEIYAGFRDDEGNYLPDVFPFRVGDQYSSVLNIDMAEGRWFNREDDASRLTPVLINQPLRQHLFGDGPALGMTIMTDWLVVGVVGNFRYYGELDEPKNAIFFRHNLADSTSQIPELLLFSVREGVTAQFQETLLSRLSTMAPGWTLGIETMDEMREFYFAAKRLPIVIFGIIAGFLIINVAMGLFGVLWYSINRRKGEIGLRRAVGANSSHVSRQILGESLVLTTFGIGLGALVALQAPILGLFPGVETSVYGMAVVCAGVAIYLVVSICAIYPSKLAATIQPAVALHNE